MVGKVKRVRQKIHQEAVKFEHGRGTESTEVNLEKAPIPAGCVLSEPAKTHLQPNADENTKEIKAFSSFPSGIFAGTKITPEALVQTLKLEEPASVTLPLEPGGEQRGKEPPKKQLSKKEKMKERRERWLNKIGAIKLAKEQQMATARRKATPVVGDMRPLADALPELSQLFPTTKTTSRKARVPMRKRPEPTDFSMMRPVQKRKLLESETSRFSEAIKKPNLKTNTLAAIGEHLRNRLRQEDEESPS